MQLLSHNTGQDGGQYGAQQLQQPQQQEDDRAPASTTALAEDAKPPNGSIRRISSAAELSASAGQSVQADDSGAGAVHADADTKRPRA